jgi:predicted nucleic-acid-binding Zn-ribbon protein
MEGLIFFLLGGIISWFISHYYYQRSDKKTPSWFSVKNIKKLLSQKPEDLDWTAKQIVNLYNRNLYDEQSGDPLPYNFCPKCGSKNLKKSMYDDYEGDESYFIITCEDCKWSDWTQ